MLKYIIQVLNEEIDEYEDFEVPGKYQVCTDCEGHGMVLTPSIRSHCYSQEEFDEEFYDDRDGDLEDGESDADHYFRRGGKYDVTCPTCKGQRVELVPDREEIAKSPENYQLLVKWEEEMEASAREAAADAKVRFYENGGRY